MKHCNKGRPPEMSTEPRPEAEVFETNWIYTSPRFLDRSALLQIILSTRQLFYRCIIFVNGLQKNNFGCVLMLCSVATTLSKQHKPWVDSKMFYICIGSRRLHFPATSINNPLGFGIVFDIVNLCYLERFFSYCMDKP